MGGRNGAAMPALHLFVFCFFLLPVSLAVTFLFGRRSALTPLPPLQAHWDRRVEKATEH